MSERVWMTHPNLPGQRIHVRPTTAGAYQASGWQLVEGGETTPQVEQAVAVLAGAGWTLTPPQTEQEPTPETETASRRRRRTEPEDKE